MNNPTPAEIEANANRIAEISQHLSAGHPVGIGLQQWMLEQIVRFGHALEVMHGPNVEHAHIEEQAFFRFVRALVQPRPVEQSGFRVVDDALIAANQQIAGLQQRIAEMQPREVNSNIYVDELRSLTENRQHIKFRRDNDPTWDDVKKLLEHISELRTELARWNGTHHGWQCELDRVKAERDKALQQLREMSEHANRLSESRAETVSDCARLREALQDVIDWVSMAEGRPNLLAILDKANSLLAATQGKT